MIEPMSPVDTKLIVVMGVSGCGKSTIAASLAKRLSFEFVEADEYHTLEAKAIMASGQPLTDMLRDPWITSICSLLTALAKQNMPAVLACSGLKKAHRDRLRALGTPTRFLYLNGDEALIGARLNARAGHFFPPILLKSQFAALDDPSGEKDVVAIDIAPSEEQVADAALTAALKFVES